MSANGDSKLQTLYSTISGSISGGRLQILPKWFPSSLVPTALHSVGGDPVNGLGISSVAATYPGGAGPISITGLVTLGTATFTAEIAIGVDADDNYTITLNLPPSGDVSPLAMTMPGAPWFSVSQPSISVATSPKLTGVVTGKITVGGYVCTATATLMIDGSWIFTLAWDSPGPSLDGVFKFIGGVNLSSALPAPLNGIMTLELAYLEFHYDFAEKQLAQFSVVLSSETYTWDVFGNGKLVLSGFNFSFERDLMEKTTTWKAIADFLINEKGPIEVTLSYTSPVFTLSGVPGVGDDGAAAKPVELTDFVNAFLPSALPNIPSQLSPGTLTSFDATYSLAAGKTAAYSLAMELDGNTSWVLSDKIVVNTVGFKIASTSDGGKTGSITGDISFFQGQPHPLDVTVAAEYEKTDEGSQWVVDTTQKADTSTDVASILGGLGIMDASKVPASLNLAVSGFTSSIHTGSTPPAPYAVVSGTVTGFKMPFDIPIELKKVTGCFGVVIGSGKGGDITPACLDAEVPLPFASLAADTTWWGVPITFGYRYTGTPAYTATYLWGDDNSIIATLSQNTDKDWVGTIVLTGSTSLGSLVEAFVSWATGYKYGLASPWSVLNDVSLSGLSLSFNFTKKTVSVTIGIGIDLGFCSVTGATITYNPTPDTGSKRVAFSLQGNFPWNAASTDKDATTGELEWDATKPETTKAPPGGGNGLLDLEMLALGQYVTIPGVATAKTVKAAIAAFEENAPVPPSGGVPALPDVAYDPTTSWLIGLDMGLLELKDSDPAAPGYAVVVQIVFDDPYLYGLRLALNGEPAKIFAGLDFEILYRKISDTLGVYQAELTLPAAMRTIQAGIYTIQLPTFAISVYTNGDFQFDVGFPWNADFSRSFTVQAIIYPGIPVLGSGGFYFGKLSSATSNSVPVVTNGTFDPVIVFGFGAQVGFGKSVSIGPLSAGFSLTVLAIIQGVIARWNGYSDQLVKQDSTQLDGSYYYSLTGTFGIAGTLNGCIDFVIIKASVNISITVTAQITFTAYAPIVLSVHCGVDVAASIEINCGLFSFSISFHFSLDLNESFSLPSPSKGPAPWQIAAGPQTTLDAGPQLRMTRVRRDARMMLLGDAVTPAWASSPTWGNLTHPAGAPVIPLQGYLTFALTAAADENNAANAAQVCYIATLAIDAQNKITPPAGLPCAATGDTSWDALCKLVTRWVVGAFWNTPLTCDGIEALVITEEELLTIHDYLAQEDANGNPLPNPIPMPVDPGAVETMLEQWVSMTVAGPADGAPGSKISVNAAFFPMPGAVGLTIPKYSTFPGYQYTFGAFNTIAEADLPLLQAYFSQLAVQVQKEQQASKPQALFAKAADTTALSVAGFVFADYFLLIARQMIANLQSGLRNYKYGANAQGQMPSVQTIVGDIKTAGGLLAGAPYTASDVFAANPGMALLPSTPLWISGATAKVQSGDTFTSIAQNAAYGSAFTASDLALANLTNAALLQAGQTVTYGTASLIVDGADSFTTLAARFTKAGTPVQPSDLANNAAIQQQANLLMPLAAIALPPFTHSTGASDTVSSFASAFGVSAASLGAPLPNGTNPNAGIAGLLVPPAGNAYVDIPHLSQLSVGALIAEAQQTGSFGTLSGMVSRFHFHGLRLPTVTTTASGSTATLITPNTMGMWVSGQPGALTLPPAAGLFALTGQQFPIPPITGTPFSITVAGGPSWLSYKTASSGAIQITSAANDPYDPAIEALRGLVTASGYRFLSGYSMPDAQSQITRTASTYSMGTHQNWLSAALPPLPAPAPPAGAVPRIWPFSNGLASLLNHETHAVNPNFLLETQTYDQASGKTIQGSVANYGWASTFEFTVKKLPLTSTVPATQGSPASGQTYQIVGANASTIVLLEDIVTQFPNDSNIWGLWLGYAPDPALRVSGLQMFGDNTAFGIGQANLSTVTRPPGMFAMARMAQDSAKGPAALNGTAANANSMFVRLLWEASITNSGGFYLYYRDGDNGLPNHLFDKNGNAVLTGVLVYGTAANAGSGASTALHDCMNAAVVADSFDPSKSALVVQAVPTSMTAPAPLTLSQIAASYYADIADTAHLNASLALASLSAQIQIAVNEGTYMVPPSQIKTGPGNQLAAIATWFGTTAQAIQAANPRQTVWPAQLAPNTALRLPPLTIIASSVAGDGKTLLTTLEAIASYFGADIVGLAVDNQDVANLFSGPVSINVGPWSSSSKLPPGSQMLQLQRDVPDPKDTSPAGLMLSQFSMLGYQIVGNQDFAASNLGIPVGPISKAGGTGSGKLRRANLLSANAPGGWTYDVTLTYTGRVIGATPASSPYLGVGRLLQVNLGWYDVYGNTIASDLSYPIATDTGPLNQSPTLLGYTDALVSLGQWPSVNASWQVAGTYPSPQLVLNFTFDTARYTGKDAPTNAANAKTDGTVYSQLLAQLGDPNGTAFSIVTSLSTTSVPPPERPLPIAVTGANLTALTTWITSIWQYLANIAQGHSATPPISPLAGGDGKPLTFALPMSALPAEQIFELTCAFTFARTAGVAEGEFAAIPGVRSTTTDLQPSMPATAAQQTNSAPGLVNFATAFELAYAGPATALKVAAGPNRLDAGTASSSTLWAVQVGSAPAPISFTVPDAGAPIIFAPKPIATQLVTNPAGIWPYTSGQVIDFSIPAPQTLTFSNIDLDQWVRTLFGAVDSLLGDQYIGGLTLLDNHSPGTMSALQAHKKSLASMYAQQMAVVFTDQAGQNNAVAAMFEQAMYEKLANAYLTQAALQYSASVNAGTIDTIPPNLYGPVTQAGAAVSGVSFTPAKIALLPSTTENPTPSEPLTVLVTTPTQSGDTTDQFVPVSLTYTATNIEHQIAPPDGSGYQASSWLRFVLPGDAFQAPLGGTKIPMVLRAYPNSPVMASQRGPSTIQHPKTLTEATEWTYAFTYSMAMHYPQDVISLSVAFNLTTPPRMLAAFADSFAALAEFVTVYPQIAPDLDSQLATLTTSAPAAQFATALAAVQSLTEMLDRIAPPAANPAGQQNANAAKRRFIAPAKRKMYRSSTNSNFTCSLQETTAADATPPAVLEGLLPTAMIVTVVVPSTGGPVPTVEMSQQYFDPLAPGDAQYITLSAGPPIVDPVTKATTQQYYFVDTTTLPTPPPPPSKLPPYAVPFTAAQGFGPRTVFYPGLQILDLQDAQASASVTRNQQLVPGRTTRPEFVYTTPDVTFTGPLRPTIVQNTPIDVGAIASSKVGAAPRSLADNLTALFYTLVSGASATSGSLQLTVTYQYPLAGSFVGMPILMQPALPVSWAQGKDTLATMIADLAAAITTWFTNVRPIGGGQIQISLTVFTTVTEQLMPLVRLTALDLQLSDVTPPLPTLQLSGVMAADATAVKAKGIRQKAEAVLKKLERKPKAETPKAKPQAKPKASKKKS